jgi:hypothetical protein
MSDDDGKRGIIHDEETFHLDGRTRTGARTTATVGGIVQDGEPFVFGPDTIGLETPEESKKRTAIRRRKKDERDAERKRKATIVDDGNPGLKKLQNAYSTPGKVVTLTDEGWIVNATYTGEDKKQYVIAYDPVNDKYVDTGEKTPGKKLNVKHGDNGINATLKILRDKCRQERIDQNKEYFSSLTDEQQLSVIAVAGAQQLSMVQRLTNNSSLPLAIEEARTETFTKTKQAINSYIANSAQGINALDVSVKDIIKTEDRRIELATKRIQSQGHTR